MIRDRPPRKVEKSLFCELSIVSNIKKKYVDSQKSIDSTLIRLKVAFGKFLTIHVQIFEDKNEMEVSGD